MTRPIAYHAQLSANAISMRDAGDFIFAMGRLLANIADHGMTRELVNDHVLCGLTAGMRVVGRVLKEESFHIEELLERSVATQNAESENVSRTSVEVRS